MHAIALLYLFLGVVFAAPKVQLQVGYKSAKFINELEKNIHTYDSKALISTINELADLILKEVRYYMIHRGFDPLQLPDVHQNFSENLYITTCDGELDLTKGLLQNSSALYRAGNVEVDYSHRKLNIEMPLNFKRFTFTYQYNAALLGLDLEGEVKGKVASVLLHSSIEIDFKKLFVTLTDFKIDRIEDIQLKFYGNSISDVIMDILSDVITVIFKGLIESVSEGIVKSVLEKIIDYINHILKVTYLFS